MAQSITVPLSLDEVRAQVKRARKEGEKLVGRLQKDARALVGTRPLALVDDARKQARTLAKQLDDRREQLLKTVTERLTGLADELRKRLGAASTHDVDALTRRVAELERRLEQVTKKAAQAAA
jgi:polyhydroxyalkanoate synthesis regulator phasin